MQSRGTAIGRYTASVLTLLALIALLAPAIMAQGPPAYPPQELDRMVSRIALYPDPLLSQVLAAATFPNDIPDAARWADQHHYLRGDQLAGAIAEDRLPWDPSVQALLPFPSVLDMMASDMQWTTDLGNAFLAQRDEMMDAVQRMRRQARDYGYLRSNGQVIVNGGPYVEILLVNPAFVCVPYYDPAVVFYRPRPGFFVGGAINFGFGVTIGTAFRPWGWGVNRFAWDSHRVFINDHVWERGWANRGAYVHPYAVQRYAPAARIPERHELHERSEHEREAARMGREHAEEHHHEERRH